MSIIGELRTFFDDWIAAVASVVETVANRVLRPRHIVLEEAEPGRFTAKVRFAGQSKSGRAEPRLPDASFVLAQGTPSPALSSDWLAAFRGSRVDVVLCPHQVMFGPLDFPAQAAHFLDGMIRSQIDRLTPWTADNVVFGLTEPVKVAPERIGVTFAAMAKSAAEPVIQLARALNAASVTLSTWAPDEAGARHNIRLLNRSLHSAIGQAANVPRILRMTLLGAGLAAAVAVAVDGYLGDVFQSEQRDIRRQIAQRRAALHLDSGEDRSGFSLLAKRKQSTPSSVMVLEALSHVLPDTTYVTELRVEGDKVQVVGMTQDAPSLVRLMELSPQFTRATFFAPTTRAQNEAGERFHIEVHITPYFGSRT